jgi:uncharacterized BrkB/YihY/UPF0761 family membrane protein
MSRRRLLTLCVLAGLALLTASGAMSALMRGLNRVHDVPETRSFA